MNIGNWRIAFTITFKGIEIDFMELPDDARLQILKGLIAGETEGTLYKETNRDWAAS